MAKAYAQYREAIESEYEQWSAFKEIAVTGNADAAQEALNTTRQNDWHVHGSKVPTLKDLPPAEAKHYDRLLLCRMAIISMRLWLINLSVSRIEPSDRFAYETAAQDCQKK